MKRELMRSVPGRTCMVLIIGEAIEGGRAVGECVGASTSTHVAS